VGVTRKLFIDQSLASTTAAGLRIRIRRGSTWKWVAGSGSMGSNL